MSDKSKIEWTESTWNPIVGTHGRWSCSKASPGCANCYAERQNLRFGGPRYVVGNDTLQLKDPTIYAPLRWVRPRRIFVCSMTDLFEERVPDHWIDRIFAVMAAAPWHTFQVLTKRAERMRDYVTRLTADLEHAGNGARWDAARRPLWLWAKEHRPKMVEGIGVWLANPVLPLRNVWLGVSVESQKWANARIPCLTETPAAVRWLSAEPLLGPIDLGPFFGRADGHVWRECLCNEIDPSDRPCIVCECRAEYGRESGIGWVVVGGESGSGARPFDVAWPQSIIAECRGAGVPVFVKQLGRHPFTTIDGAPVPLTLSDHRGGVPEDWPESLRVREWPG